ncbi:MAG: hypothetical protein CL868_07115 [Cytophagaceae bacterium]|nr:hypothetical protein [Cytophagaceae bacterium]|tara:strand:- start:56282 stop:57253 length:972 start_codon:yes stop_codon:yes gene_type:complete
MEQKENQEVDLFVIFNRIGNGIKYVLGLLYRLIYFFLQRIKIIALLLIVGLIIGFVIDLLSSPKYKTVYIIRSTNATTSYLYEAISNLNQKIENNDTLFLKSIELDGDFSLKEVEIKPIVNVSDVLEKYKEYDDNQVLSLIERIDTKNDFLEAESFLLSYQYHYLTIYTGTNNRTLATNKVLDHLEQNNYLKAINENTLTRYKNRIEENIYSIKQIDSFLSNTNKALTSNSPSSSQLMLINSIDIGGILQKKTDLLRENEGTSNEILRMQNLFQITNNPYSVKDSTLLSHKVLLLPFVILFCYVSYQLAKKLYLKAKKYSADN